MRASILFAAILSVSLLLTQACSGTPATALSCTASGTVISGNIEAAGSVVEIDNVDVYLYGGGSGPYTVTLPGVGAASTTSTTYTYAGTISAVTSAADVLSSTVTVEDSSTGETADCSLTDSSATATSSTIQVTASPSTTAVVGSTIDLTAIDTSGTTNTTDSTFSFVPMTTTSGVNVSTLSANSASVYSSIATTVTLTVTETEVESGTSTVVGSTEITVSFTGTATTGSVEVSALPSTTAPVGTAIMLTASSVTGAVNPTFSFVPEPTDYETTDIASYSQASSNTYTVTGLSAGTVTIIVNEYAAGTTTAVATSTITLTFTGSLDTIDSTGSLICTLSGPSEATLDSPVTFNITSNTGEPVYITQWVNSGDPWSTQPPYPLSSPVEVEYTVPQSSVEVEMWAESAETGIPCNGGSPLTTTIELIE